MDDFLFPAKSDVMKMNTIKFNYALQSLLTAIHVIYITDYSEHETLVMIITVHVIF